MNLANGYLIPDIGFGTFQTPDGEVCVNAVREAIAVGYTHIDTAAIYQNEVSVGEGVRQSGKARNELSPTVDQLSIIPGCCRRTRLSYAGRTISL